MAFSKALADNGITFIGPAASAIQAMGNKIESKKLVESLKVSTIPGFNGEITDEKHLLKVGVVFSLSLTEHDNDLGFQTRR